MYAIFFFWLQVSCKPPNELSFLNLFWGFSLSAFCYSTGGLISLSSSSAGPRYIRPRLSLVLIITKPSIVLLIVNNLGVVHVHTRHHSISWRSWAEKWNCKRIQRRRSLFWMLAKPNSSSMLLQIFEKCFSCLTLCFFGSQLNLWARGSGGLW